MTDTTQLDDALRVTDCERCPNLCESRSRIVNGVGPLDADIVLVGEAPGANEDETGEPFVGRSGDILNEALEAVNLSRKDIRITNCVRCRPPENRDPHVAELTNCTPHLEEELERIDPAVVVPLGRIPVERLLGDIGKVSEVAGTVHDREDEGWCGTFVASVHPAATLYNRSLRPVFDETFETVSELAASK